MDQHTTEPKPKPIVPILAALLVVAIGAAVFFALGGGRPKEKIKVPDLSYLQRAEAEEELKKMGLKLGEVTEEDNADIPQGYVIKQNPVANADAEKDSEVNIVLTKGRTKSVVPDLRGMSPEDAEKALYNAWLVPVPGNPVNSDDVEPGKVCTQSVDAGTEVDVLSNVSYATSLGKETVAVPDVTGKNVDDARNMLADAGLGCDTSQSYSDTVDQNVVISQSIPKDDKVERGTVVTVEVSLGKKPPTRVNVPNIITYTSEEAIRALESAGLRWENVGDTGGRVIETDPKVGTEVDQGTVVRFKLNTPQPQTQQQTQPQQQQTQQQTQPQQQPDDQPEPRSYMNENEAEQRAITAAGANEDDIIEVTCEIQDADTDDATYRIRIDAGDNIYVVLMNAYTGEIKSVS